MIDASRSFNVIKPENNKTKAKKKLYRKYTTATKNSRNAKNKRNARFDFELEVNLR